MTDYITGKGAFIWQPWNVEKGDPVLTAEQAVGAGLSHVLVKIANDKWAFGIRLLKDYVPDLVKELKARNIQVWGWHYVKGNDPFGEAEIAISRVKKLDLAGYVIDAEFEYKQAGKASAARRFMTLLRQGLGGLPIGLSSYRFPSFHRDFPWLAFLEKCDFNMPQVYWEGAHNSDEQLQRCVNEFQRPDLVGFVRPVVPTGAAYGTGTWRSSPNDISKFFAKAKELGLSGANIWSWDWATSKGNLDLWDALSSFEWESKPEPMIAVRKDSEDGFPQLMFRTTSELKDFVDRLIKNNDKSIWKFRVF